MKKILIYLSAMLWLLMSCQEPELLEGCVSDLETDKVEISFSVLLPDEADATKALGDDPSTDIKSLHLVVFDENGYYIETCEATWDPSNAQECTHRNEQPFKVTLRKTEKERIIHFIANCPESQIHYGHESDIISGLYTQRGTALETAYWARSQVWYIKTKDDDKTLVDEVAKAFKCVPLLRNYASVTVKDNASDFVMESYAIYNTIDKGTVAPYNVNAHGFQSFVNGDAGLLSYGQLLSDHKYEGHASAQAELKHTLTDSDFIAPGQPVYMYERKVSVRPGVEHQWSESPPHIIIKGRYQNAAAYSYYKVDMLHYDADEKGYYYNILRNFKYTFTINTVAGPGYSTLEEAMNNPAGNNLAGATDTQGFTNVSDGLGRIFVSYTDTTLTSNNDVVLRYKYVPSIQEYEVVANERVKVDGILDGTGTVIKGVSSINYNAGDGWAEVTMKVQNPGAITHLQEVILNVTDNSNLHKTIRYRLQKPFEMLVNCWPKAIARKAGKQINVAIRLPDYLTEDMFPLDFAIEVENLTLSPDASQQENEMPVEPAYSIVPSKQGKRSYYFIKTIDTYQEYQNLERYEGKKLVNTYWLTTKAENASNVYVYNKYFSLANDRFDNAEEFTLLSFPDGAKEGIGQETLFEFNMNTITPVTVALQGLTDASGRTSFVYEPSATGRQKLTLKTAQQSGTVKVTLNATNYAEASLEVQQSSEIQIDKLTITFAYRYNSAPGETSVKPTLTMSGAYESITYRTMSTKRSGKNRDYTYTTTVEGIVITGASDQSVLNIVYTRNNYTFKGSIKVSDMKRGNATVTLTE